jgi:hypothetical protein
MGSCCRLLESFSCDRGLPMAAAVTTTTTTVGAATAAHCSSAAYRATMESTADCYMRSTVEAAADCATVPTITAVPAITTVPTVAAAITGASVESAAVPRARTDEQATGEVARAVVTVRRASIRVIAVVTVRADRSRPNVARTDAHANYDALRISVRR